VSDVEMEYETSEGHACRLVGLGRSTYRYRLGKAERDVALRLRQNKGAQRIFGYAPTSVIVVLPIHREGHRS
jgi:hypothetical protein